jgi:hypothetical protein
MIEQGARAIGCDPINLVLPALTTLAGAIGVTRRVQVKRGWVECAIIWTLLIGASGRMRKSPALAAITRPIRRRQERELRKHKAAMKVYEAQVIKYEAAKGDWKRERKSNPGLEPPEPPERPVLKRLIVSDTTVEALTPILQENPRGVTLVRDELAGWLKGFDQYKPGGQGGDVPQWLEAHQGGAWLKDRRTDREVLSVPRAAVCVTGTTQPAIARACLKPEYFQCGLAARLFVAQPPPRLRVWTNDEVSSATEAEWAHVIDELCKLDFDTEKAKSTLRLGANEDDSENEGPTPIDLPLTDEAQERFARFVNDHGVRTAAADDDMGAALAKLEGAAARFALILHLADGACGAEGVSDKGPIGLRHIEAGIEVAEWFANEAERVYTLLREDPGDAARRELSERIRDLGGEVTIRQLMQHVHRFKTAAVAEAALEDLVKNSLGSWVDKPPGPKGGRPTKAFVLRDSQPPAPVDIDTTPETPRKSGVSSMSTPGNDPPPPPPSGDPSKGTSPARDGDLGGAAALPPEVASAEGQP